MNKLFAFLLLFVGIAFGQPGFNNLSASGGSPAPYTLCSSGCSTTIPASSFAVTAATHGQGKYPYVFAYNASNQPTAINWTIDTSGNLTAITYTGTLNLVVIASGSGTTGPTGATGAAGTNGSPGAGNNTLCVDATGSTTTYTCPTPSLTVTSLTGLIVAFTPQTTNTGTSTLNVAGLGAVTLKQANGSTNVAASALAGGSTYLFQYNGTNFVQLGATGGSITGTANHAVIIGGGGSGFADSGIPYVSGCGVVNQCATGSLTQAQITALSGTPITLVPTGGAGTFNILDSVTLELVFNTAAYTFTGTLAMKYTNGTGTTASGTCASGFLTAGQTEVCGILPSALLGSTAALANEPIVLTASTAATCGSTCGSVNYWVKYHVATGF